MRISIHNDQPPSQLLYEEFDSNNTLARLRALVSRVRRKGFDELDPAKNPLVPLGMEVDAGAVIKNGYGVFDLAWQAEKHPEWPGVVEREIEDIRPAFGRRTARR